MPTVPVYSNFQATPNGAPDVPFQASSAPTGAEINARQTADLGTAVQRAGDTGSRIALSMQDQVNGVRANDAVNQYRRAALDLAYNPETGYLALKGDAALTRPSGQALPDEYGDKLRLKASEIAATLGNPEQQRIFGMAANDISTQFHGQVENHMLEEFRSHALSVQSGTIDLASNDARLNWNNPDKIFGGTDEQGNRVPGSIDAIKAAVVEQGRLAGWSASQTTAAMAAAVSHAHSGVVQAALLNNNPAYAFGYLDRARKAGEMTADDLLKLQGHINQNVWLSQSTGAVQAATTAARPLFDPGPDDRLLNIVLQQESGGRDFAPDGTPLQGPANYTGERAMYRMQVMPSTAANPGHGIAPAAADTPAEYNRVGAQLLHALLQKYGNPAQAMAAYNWGEGNLDKALKEANADIATGAFPGAVDPNYWMSKLPPETLKYVQRGMAQFASAGGMPPRPTELQFQQTAIAHLPPNSPPQLVNMTIEHAHQQFAVITKTMQEQGESALDAAQRWLWDHKGTASTVDQMPYELQEAVNRSAPGKMDDLVKFNHTLANDEFKHSDPRLVNDLTRRIYLPDGDPNKITQPAQIMQFMGKGLAYQDQQRLIKETAQANTPEGSPFLKQMGQVKTTARKMLVDNFSSLAHPELAEEAAYRFGIDLDGKVAGARAAGTDPQALFTPGSKDYVLDPSRVAAFMPTPAQIAASKAAALKAGAAVQAPAAPPIEPRVSTRADYAALPPGAIYMDPNGLRKRKPAMD